MCRHIKCRQRQRGTETKLNGKQTLKHSERLLPAENRLPRSCIKRLLHGREPSSITESNLSFGTKTKFRNRRSTSDLWFVAIAKIQRALTDEIVDTMHFHWHFSLYLSFVRIHENKIGNWSMSIVDGIKATSPRVKFCTIK